MAAVPFESALLDAEEYIDECDELDLRAMAYVPPKKTGTGGTPDFKDRLAAASAAKRAQNERVRAIAEEAHGINHCRRATDRRQVRGKSTLLLRARP